MSDGEDAELLVYLVDEEMDIYIGVLVLVLPPCQPGTAQLGPSATSVSPNLYELVNGGHSVAYIEQKRKKDLDTLPYIPMYGKLLKGFRAVPASAPGTRPIRNRLDLGRRRSRVLSSTTLCRCEHRGCATEAGVSSDITHQKSRALLTQELCRHQNSAYSESLLLPDVCWQEANG
jgi:hypothetical protein